MLKLHASNMLWKNMENNIYFDTNVFIDLMDSTRPYAKGSAKLFRNYLSGGKMLYINSDTVTNAFYVMSKTRKYSQEELYVLFKKLIGLFVIVSVENEESLNAFSLCEDAYNACKDYEDTLQYICAKKADADIIVTNDKQFVSLDIETRGTKI